MDNIDIGRRRAVHFISNLNPPSHTMFYGPYQPDSIGYCPYSFQDKHGTHYAPTIKTSLSNYIKIHPKLLYTNINSALYNDITHILVLCFGWWDPTRIYIFQDIPAVRQTKGWKYHVFKESQIQKAPGVMTFDQFLKFF